MNKNVKKRNLKNLKIDKYGLIQLEHFDKYVLELECAVIANILKYTS
jgi:hypothetical protein